MKAATIYGWFIMENLSIYGGFLKRGVPPNHPFIDRFSIINHPAIGVPIFMETSMSLNSVVLCLIFPNLKKMLMFNMSISLVSPSIFECHSSHSKPAPSREVPREKKIQVRPNDKRFQRPSEHWYLPNRKVGKLEIEGKKTAIYTWKRFSILGIPMLG